MQRRSRKLKEYGGEWKCQKMANYKDALCGKSPNKQTKDQLLAQRSPTNCAWKTSCTNSLLKKIFLWRHRQNESFTHFK